MKTISYAGNKFLTGDAIANALLEISQLMAERRNALNVEIPVRSSDGSIRAAVFLVGPASQIVAEDADSWDYEELIDREALHRLTELKRRLQSAR